MTAAPFHIAHYEIRREIGRGGMGIVYLARDGRLEHDVAIKALGDAVAGDAQRLARFKREARLIAQLNHPHIAQIYHLLDEGGRDPPGAGVRPGPQSLNSLGNSAYYRGNLAEAQRLHERGLAINRERSDRTGIATSLNNLANVATDCKSFVEAQRLYEEALEINRRAGHRASEAINLNNLGLVAQHCGDLVRARVRHEESLAIRRELSDPHGIAESLTHLAKVTRDEGDLAGARRLHEESLAAQRDLGDRLGIADSLDAIAMLATRLGEHDRAARLLGAVERLRADIGSPRPRPEQQTLDASVADLRAALGRDGFEELVDAGRAVTLDDVIAATLQWLHSDRAAAAKATTVLMTDGAPRGRI